MEERLKSTGWKPRLTALFVGVLVITLVVALDVSVSSDLRLIYTVTATLLFCCALWFGQKRRDWAAALLLVSPSLAGFSFYILKYPDLWPNDVLWIAVVVFGTVIVDLVRKQRELAIAFVVALLVASGWYCFSYLPDALARSSSRVKDSSAPTFTLVSLSDGARTGPEPGRILVIDFFSTVCAPCIAELPQITAVRSDLSNDHDVEFVLVGSDQFVGNDTPERIRAFAQRRHLTLPLAFDRGGKAHDSFGLTGVPALVVLDRSGRVRLTREGYNPAETNFRHDLVQFLKSL